MIKAKIAAATYPKRKKALKAQLKAQKKVAALRKKLLAAPKAKRAALKKLLKAAKAKLAKINAKVNRVSKAVFGKKSKAVKAKIQQIKK